MICGIGGKKSVFISQALRTWKTCLLVGAILACTHVDKVEQCLPAREAAHEVFKDANLLDSAGANEDIAETADVGVHAANDSRPERDVHGFGFDIFLDSRVELRGCATATSLALAEEFVGKLWR